MAATYYLLLTEYGQTKIAALLSGETILLTDVAIGDANGQPYLPESRLDETDLVNERARVPVQSVAAVGDVTTVIATIDSTIGGFNFHELAILDDTGSAVYLGNYHGQYKPVLTEGAGGEIELNLDLGSAGIGPVFLEVDPTVVTANKAWVIANFVRITTFDAHVIAEAEARVAGDAAAIAHADSLDLARAIDTLNKLNVEAYIRDLADTNEAAARVAGDNASQVNIDNLAAKLNSFLDEQGNGSYGVGTHSIKVYPSLSKTFTLWGAGAGGSGSRTAGVAPSAATDGGDTSITELSVVAGGGDAGTGGTWANGSAYTDGTAGTGGVAAGANISVNGNNGVASVSDQSGGGAAGASGHGAGGQGSVGLGDDGYSYGGGGGSGAKAVHTYTNTTSSVVTLTLVVGSKGLASAHGSGMANGDDGFATVSS